MPKLCDVLVATMLVVASAAPAIASKRTASRSGACKAASEKITEDRREAAYLGVQASAEDSAVRATLYATKQARLSTEVQTLLGQLKEQGCAAYKGAVTPDAYIPAAGYCLLTESAYEQHRALLVSQANLDTQVKRVSDPDAPATPVKADPEGDARVKSACDRSQWAPQ